MNYKKLIKKIEESIDFTPKQADLCRILQLSTSTMARRVKRDSNFSDAEIRKLEEHYGISLMVHNSTHGSCVSLDYYPDVYGSCGYGAKIFDDSKEKITVPTELIPNATKTHKYTVINARGLSMYPLICDLDKLVVQKYEGEQIVDNNVYVFMYNGEIFIKRLLKNLDQIVVISENKDYENRIIYPDADFCIMGKVVGLLRERV